MRDCPLGEMTSSPKMLGLEIFLKLMGENFVFLSNVKAFYGTYIYDTMDDMDLLAYTDE